MSDVRVKIAGSRIRFIQSGVQGTNLSVGSGWSGSTSQPSAIGTGSEPFYDARVIGRWDQIPYQKFDADINIGVVAFHGSGVRAKVNRVEFSCDNGPWVSVETPSYNPQSDVVEYWVTLPIAAFGSNQTVEVRAIAYPEVGEPRVLSGMFLHARPAGIDSDVIYCSSSGSNTGTGTALDPFGLELDYALEAVADGGTIELATTGTYYCHSFARSLTSNTHWITVRAASGLDRDSVRIQTNPSDPDYLTPYIAKLKWEGVRFDFGNSSVPGAFWSYQPGPNNYVWFHNCKWTYNDETWEPVGILFPIINDSEGNPNFSYATNCHAYKGIYAFCGMDMVRNCTADLISGAAFVQSKLVINSELSNSYPGMLASGYHLDYFHTWGTLDNHIYYGATMGERCEYITYLRITADYAGPGSGLTNFAAVDIDGTDQALMEGGGVANFGGPPYNECGQYGGAAAYHHAIFVNVHLPNQRFDFTSDTMTSCLVENFGFHWGSFDKYNDTPELWPGVTFRDIYEASFQP